ncbi:hypothetical protein KBB85_05710 [Patescibacteria group bacterium]|nr:hypothetical protein [Patescibacteria group bacterium]
MGWVRDIESCLLVRLHILLCIQELEKELPS